MSSVVAWENDLPEIGEKSKIITTHYTVGNTRVSISADVKMSFLLTLYIVSYTIAT